MLKPAGITSHDAVSAVRRLFGTKKAGHTGTLDPMATGVLPVCVGTATRAVEYLESDEKEYRCELILGVETDTADIWGSVTSSNPEASAAVTVEDVKCAFSRMKGAQQQYPPMYSAIRVKGKKLYEYARSGEAVEVKPRDIFIYKIKLVSIFHEPGRVIFDVHCSKGTYVRSICRDVGEILGCGACMSALIRTRSGRFVLSKTVSFEDIKSKFENDAKIAGADIDNDSNRILKLKAAAELLMPTDSVLEGFGKIKLSDTEKTKYVNGGKVAFRNVELLEPNNRKSEDRFANLFSVYDSKDIFIGTATADADKRIYAVGKVFVR